MRTLLKQLAEYFIKQLQENIIGRFRDVIMGYKHINDLLMDPGFLLKERAEKLNNIVIKKSETNNKKDQMTHADVVKTVSLKNVISNAGYMQNKFKCNRQNIAK